MSPLREEQQCPPPEGLRGVPGAITVTGTAWPFSKTRCSCLLHENPCRPKNQVQGHRCGTQCPSFKPHWLISSSLASYRVPKWARRWNHTACLQLLEHANALPHPHADARAASSALKDLPPPSGKL